LSDDRDTPVVRSRVPSAAMRETMRTLIVFGEAVPVDFDVYDGRALGLWWEPPADGCKRRLSAIKNVVYHHTAGEGDAEQVFSVLRARHLSVHLFVDEHGRVYQMADLEETQCYHAGYANGFSIGIEFQNKGVIPTGRVDRVAYDDAAHGRRIRYLRMTNPQCASAFSLTKALCDIYGFRRSFPVDERGKVLRTAMAPRDVARWHGLLGHMHLTANKIDPSPHLMDELQYVLSA
jgi:hypothetical protein